MDSISRSVAEKPAKPHKDFPLYAHASGRWAKKVRGRTVFFGKWDDPQAALNKWIAEKDYLLAGRPVPRGDGLVVGDLCNQFLTVKRASVDSGEIRSRSWGDYYATCESVVAELGRNTPVEVLGPPDFQRLRSVFAKRSGPEQLGNQIRRVRTLFKWAFDSELIDRPVRTGPDFRKPAKHILRKARASNGPKMFEADELRAMIAAAEPRLRAMILLALNGGLGNTDVGNLQLEHINLKTGWLDYARIKTGIHRRIPLWLETVAALREVIAVRPAPYDNAYADWVFLADDGLPWIGEAKIRDNGNGVGARRDHVMPAFRQLLDELGFYRPGWGFYTLRHVFQTIGSECGDELAVSMIMGHADHSMAAHYRERFDDGRLVAVTEHVRKWLFSKSRKAK